MFLIACLHVICPESKSAICGTNRELRGVNPQNLNIMKRTIFTVALMMVVISAGAQQKIKVSVAAAANLRDVMAEIESLYEQQNPQVDLAINYGASGMFVQQIANGAGYDLFFSADQDYAQSIYDKGLAVEAPMDYAQGKLIIYSKSIEVETIGMDALFDSRVRRIAVANPKAAPYGRRAVDMLVSMGIYDDLESKIIYGDNIASTAQYAFTANAELGILALSQVKSPGSEIGGLYYIIPSELYEPVLQSCVVIEQKGDSGEAIKFRDFTLSEACSELWTKFGYESAK